MKTSAELRQAFLTFFEDKGHEIVASSSLVPGNDPTLLFTNAGMVQFKDVFLGRDKRSYTRATSSQRCVRAGGKHNDLENVGYTARHHTFFEMLGNFSFGDYFKEDAIKYAWEFLTEVVGLPAEKLWVTVYEDDTEAADIWLNTLGVDASRFSRIGDKPGGKKYESDNFWAMGDTGPCGPCTEIFYDHGEHIWGGPPGTPDEDGDRYIEIWNLVFMQYNRTADGEMNELPAPSVDTGMGLERLAAILQGVHNNYDIDIFQHLIKAAARVTSTADRAIDLENKSLRVIADHIRSCSFLIVDDVTPSNEGRGYVLRRIIRRACRHGHQLGMNDLFFYKLVQPLVEVMGDAYPELVTAQSNVERVLKMEEQRFAETLDHGMKILEEDIAQLQDKTITGETLFKLYDTYGFPVDLTADIARERGLEIDEEGFDACMEAQRERGRSASQFGVDYNKDVQVACDTVFTGYQQRKQNSTVLELFAGSEPVETLAEGQQGIVVLNETPFYGESGGQVGDTGLLISSKAKFIVKDTQKQGKSILHIGLLQTGSINKGDELTAEIDFENRKAISRNHSATHLMHAALQKVLGEHVSQKGSLVDAEKLRFDFSHFEPIKAEQLKEIERIVNAQIRGNSEALASEMGLEAAKASGAMALFGEKYGDVVRVVTMGNDQFSTELCGGVHVNRVGDIGFFKIISESGIASGVRRIEAVTGEAAVNWVEDKDQQIDTLAQLLKSSREEITSKVEQLIQKLKEQEKQLTQLKGKMASQAGSDLSSQAEDIGGVKILTAHLDGADSNTLRDTLDQLKNKLGTAAIVLACEDAGKVKLIAGVSKDLTKTIKAGELVNVAAAEVGGKGGGRPDMAQAGGTNPAAIPQALAAAKSWLQGQL
jgi:alanyl-tRNA synthetase